MNIEKEIYNWKYIFNNNSFEIIPNEPYDQPKILFKLYGIGKYSVDALINQYVYAPHPSQFNDIFDCNEELLNFDDNELILAYLSEVIPKRDLEVLLHEHGDNLPIFFQRIFRETIYRKLGVFSMTGNPNNILMWSYYGENKGFCIEFEVSAFPFKYYGPFPLNYQPELEPLSIKEIGTHIGVLAQSNLKHNIWKHENEWRLLIEAPEGEDMISPNFKVLKDLGGHDRKFNYPISAIKSVALGNRFFDPDEIREVSGTILEIDIQTDVEEKTSILDFLATNKILTHIGLRTGLTEIKFRKSVIERIDSGKFKVIVH